jgi:hypothetical protein
MPNVRRDARVGTNTLLEPWHHDGQQEQWYTKTSTRSHNGYLQLRDDQHTTRSQARSHTAPQDRWWGGGGRPTHHEDVVHIEVHVAGRNRPVRPLHPSRVPVDGVLVVLSIPNQGKRLPCKSKHPSRRTQHNKILWLLQGGQNPKTSKLQASTCNQLHCPCTTTQPTTMP